MTDAEHLAYRARLVKSEMKGNVFGIHCLLGQPITVVQGISELIRQLKAIGNNLNQIAKSVNAGQATTLPVVADLEKGVKEIWQLLRQVKVENH
jgi:hypothetical protein